MLFIPRFVIVGGAALLSLPSFAGAPAPFDNWAANNGNVAAGCGGANSGLNCAVLNAGPGFLQQQVRDPTTKLTYIQTIVTNPSASGAAASQSFSSENFVRTGTFDSTLGTGQTIPTNPQQTAPQLVTNGIASQQRLHAEDNKATKTGVFDAMITINTGWAATAGSPNVDINQSVSETGTDGTKFTTTARILGNNDNNGTQTGTNITLNTLMSQPKTTATNGSTSGGSGWGSSVSNTNPDVQVFALRRVGGNLLATSGSATLSSRSVAWKPGDVVQTMWLGQGFDFGSFGGSGMFGFQSFDNLSDAASQISSSSTNSAGPFTWVDPPFGTKPVMPANGGNTGGGGRGW